MSWISRTSPWVHRLAAIRTPLCLATLSLSGCHLYSLQDGCGPLYDGGSTCVIPTTGSGTSGGTGTNTGTSTGGTTGGPPCTANGLPCAPVSVSATGAKSSADLTWTPAFDNGSAVTGYIVTANPSGGPGALNLGAVTAAVFPSLTPGTSYTFSVVALNSNGQGPAGVSNAVVPFDVPGPPSNITAQPGQSSVVVSWTAAPGNGLPITGYTVTATPGPETAMSDGGATTAIVTGLIDTTSYTFSVAAQNDAGVGPPATSGAAIPFAIVTTLAGDGDAGWLDGPGDTAQFYDPVAIAVDAQGYVYVADTVNERIRKIDPDGGTTTLAGNPSICDAGPGCFADGTGGPNGGTAFFSPRGVAVDSNGFVYVADTFNHRIRKVAPDGTTTTLAGNGDAGYLDDVGGNAEFSNPTGIALDMQGNVYVGDVGNSRIRKIAPDGTTTTLAGNGDAGYTDGVGPAAAFWIPAAVAVDLQGNVYVSDFENLRIRKITPNGTTTTLAGNGTFCDAGYYLTGCYADGSGGPDGGAAFDFSLGISVDANGYVYVGETADHRIRKVAPNGTTTTLAGNGMSCDAGSFLRGCYADGTGGPDGTAEFAFPRGVAVDPQDNVYVADLGNQRIRKISQ